MLIFTSAVRPTIFKTVQRAQRRKTSTLQVRLRVLCCEGAGIVKLEGVEVCGGRGRGVWWEGWGVWWEGCCVSEVGEQGGAV